MKIWIIDRVNLFAIIGSLFMGGCSTYFTDPDIFFESRQLSFIRTNLFKADRSGPEPNWGMYWLNEERRVYAINMGGEVLFANEFGDLAHFDGWQIVEVRNLFPGNDVMRIRRTSTGLEYSVGDRVLTEHFCEKWRYKEGLPPDPGRVTEYVQECMYQEGSYRNSISLNLQRQLVDLTFKVNPEYPALKLKLL